MSNGKNGGQPGTYLVIPYYTGDVGARPLPSSVPFWACNSIKVNGSPYSGQPLIRGQIVDLTLDAINWGTLTTPAVCTFWWANPTTMFSNNTVTYIDSTSVALARGALTAAPSVAWTVPQSIPGHACLLAEITSQPDHPATQDYDAATDRHFGQQNIHVMDAAAGGQIQVGFTMGSSSAKAAFYRLEATSLIRIPGSLSYLLKSGAALYPSRRNSSPGQ